MSARAAILDALRAATNHGAPIDARRATAQARLEAVERHPIPERVAGKDSSVLRTTFEAHLESQSAVVRSGATPDDVPEIVAGYLRESNLPQRVRTGSDDALAAIDWALVPTLEVTTGPAGADDAVGLSRAIAGVAETGTLILGSGDANPVTLNFLPETHIVLVDAATVVGPYEDAFDAVRARYGKHHMPRTLNMISGPSRTGDIGGRLVMGAHGPRRMLVIVVEDGLGSA